MKRSDQMQLECNAMINQKNTVQSRVRELERIKNEIYGDLSGRASRAEHDASEASDRYQGGLKGNASSGAVSGQIRELGEKSVSSDSYMANVIGSIDDEIGRCNAKISSLESSIQNKNREIQVAKDNERREELQKLAEAAKKREEAAKKQKEASIK